MKRGRKLLEWTEPEAWRRRMAASLAEILRTVMGSRSAWLTTGLIVGLPAGISWLGADPEKRLAIALVPVVVLAGAGGLLVFFSLFNWIFQRVPSTLAIYENQLVHTTSATPEAVPLDEIEGVFFDTESEDGEVFRRFIWLCRDGELGFAAMPEPITESQVSGILLERGVPPLELDDEEEMDG